MKTRSSNIGAPYLIKGGIIMSKDKGRKAVKKTKATEESLI